MDPFKNIRPYNDAEVAGVLQSLSNNPSVLKALIGFQETEILLKLLKLMDYLQETEELQLLQHQYTV